MREKAETIPGLVDVYSTLQIDNPELLASIDRERAAALGVEVREIADTLRVAVGGDDRVSRYRDRTADDAYDVELRLGRHRSKRRAIDFATLSCAPIRISTAFGSRGLPSLATAKAAAPLTRIDNVVRFEFNRAASRIDRLNRQRMVAVRANVAGGYALRSGIDLLKQAADEIGVPPGFQSKCSAADGNWNEHSPTLVGPF